jgi:hypothetical protein
MTNSKGVAPEANSRPSSQDIPFHLQKLKVQHRLHNRPPQDPVVSSVRIITSHLSKIYFNVLPSIPRSSKRPIHILRLNLCILFPSFKCVLHALPVSVHFNLITLKTSGTRYEAFHYFTFPILLLLPPFRV